MRHLKLASRVLALAVSLTAIASAYASGTVGPGSMAPKLDVKTWLKGTPVKTFDDKKTYVVEFWATWCGPCLESIPHLTELAKKNKDVTFIGVSIWEDEEGDKLPKFVEKMGGKMDYNVGYSGNKEGMATTWMEAAGQNGIPTAFVVKNQKIQWIGHPMELEKPLAEIKAGKFDSVAFKKEFDKQAAANREAMAANKELRAASKLFDDGKRAEAKAALDAAVKKYPTVAESADQIRYGWLAEEDPAAWEAQTTQKLASGKEDEVMNVAMFALQRSQTKKDEIARKAIDMALKANAKKNIIAVYYGSATYMQLGDNKTALDLTNQVIEMMPTSQLKDNQNFKEAMQKQKTELEAKVSK